ncbi:MAG TPA: TIGR04076 family protein [Firmicutes bacterium]|nr:TIGR04076 family protein [Bacillota bacterium]
MYRVKVTVESIAGECAAGCRIGDVFYYDDGSITVADARTRLCAYGLAAIIPYLAAYCRRGEAGDWIGGLERLACPDPENNVVFRLERSEA